MAALNRDAKSGRRKNGRPEILMVVSQQERIAVQFRVVNSFAGVG